ncbi:rRNA-processing protein bfr2 [Xylographa trunciseda]|nr:rRNA-processing protein bfr2 [Xylographa trunciseda]
MAKPRPFKTLAEQIADLDDPAPRDIDPEEFGGPVDRRHSSGSSSDDEDQVTAREHYEDVGESKLRKPHPPSLGPRYSGSRVSRADLGDGDESSDGPFGSGASGREDLSEEEDGVVDPDEVDLAAGDGAAGGDEDIDSEEAFGEGDEEAFKGFAFGGSGERGRVAVGLSKMGGSRKPDVEGGDGDMSSDEDGMDEGNAGLQDGRLEGGDDPQDSMSLDGSASEDDDLDDDSEAASNSNVSSTDSSSPEDHPPTDDRAALRQMMAEERTTVLATISRAAKADAAKGRAVHRQRSTFDALLNTRIRLQKALIATNSLAADPPAPDTAAPVHAAEAAALALFNSLSALLHSLHPSLPPAPLATRSTPPSTIQNSIHALSTTSLPLHRATLTKWASKTHLPTALPPRARLAPSTTTTTQPLLAVLDTHLSPAHLPRLLARTHVPRSCAPLQALSPTTAPTSTSTTTTTAAIFDDADFYALLLRDLVARKLAARPGGPGLAPSSTHSAAAAAAASDASALTRAAKVRKRVDTKASKGRKMRYAVHERLQNFMAREDRGAWGEGRAGELFAGLVGRGVRGGLGEGGGGEDGDGDGEGEGDGGEEEGEGLRLFGGGG